MPPAPAGGFFWILFQVPLPLGFLGWVSEWVMRMKVVLTLSIFLGVLLPAAQYAVICAFLKAAFRQNHRDFLALTGTTVEDVR